MGGSANNSYCGYDKPRHGCDVEIDYRSSGRISHLRGYDVTYPTVRSYPDGLKVGCTFITTEALKHINERQQAFVKGKTEKTWQ